MFKFDPVTDALVTVVDFTGNSGAHKGSYVRAGLTNDGHGFMWGVTTGGGVNERGTIFKIEERTGAFFTVHEFGLPTKRSGPAGAGPETELVDDHKGYLWGTTKAAVYKVHMQSGTVKVIATFGGSRGSYKGSEPEALALDGQGFIWGAALGEPRKESPGTIFKINTNTDAVTVLEELADAHRGTASITYRQGDMCWDGQSGMWFAGAYKRGSPYTTRTLVKMNTKTGAAEQWYRQPDFAGITTPVLDDRGLMWGLSSQGGAGNNGSVYCFEPTSKQFTTVMSFTGAGPQARTGEQPERTRLFKHSDGNLYAGTRYGGPGNGGTIFRLRFGPSPVTQEATLLADGSAVLHGTLRPNGLDSEASFEWGTDVAISSAASISAGVVSAVDSAKSVSATLTGLKPDTTYYFRCAGRMTTIASRNEVLFCTSPLPPGASLRRTMTAETDPNHSRRHRLPPHRHRSSLAGMP